MAYSQTIESDVGWVGGLTFTADGEYLVGGGNAGVRVWRVDDGERIATMKAPGSIECVAVSKDGRFIAAGTDNGDVLVWDGTYKQVFAEKIPDGTVFDVDFSPDSKRLVSAAEPDEDTVTIWDIAARKIVQTLHTVDIHRRVYAAKYSPEGNRIATTSMSGVRVWDSDDGQLLVDLEVVLRPWCGLLWFNTHLFVQTKDNKIKQIDAYSGSTVAECSVPYDFNSRIALPQHGQFIAYSTRENITFWDTFTHTKLGIIPRTSESRLIAFSDDDQLAMVVQERKIVVKDIVLISEPHISIESAALHAWKSGQLTKADGLLTAIPRAKDTAYHVLASRALVRARLQQWDTALDDAEESIEIQPSAFGYIAKCVALVGKGDTDAGHRVCDIASLLFYSEHLAILLIKAVVLFKAGEHDDAISRIDDLIAVRPSNPMLYVVQAYMHLLCGNLHMESGDSKRAIQSFEVARRKLGSRKERPLLIISLISGWKFDDLAVTIELRLCEALLSVGRVKEAGDSVLHVVDRELNMVESFKTRVSDLMQRCLVTAEIDNASSITTSHSSVLHPMTLLLRRWARSRLTTSGLWKNALNAAHNFTVPRFIVYQVICEQLETNGHLADAVSCFHGMCDELAQEMDGEQAVWTRDFESRSRGKLEDLGDCSMNCRQYNEAISQYTTALTLNPTTPQALLGKRSKAHAGKGEWDDALNDSTEVIKLDPSSPLGYERKHAALYGIGRHGDATDAFETMLLKMSESSDPSIREQSRHYIRPAKTKETVRTTIEDVIRDSPPVLIDTIHGRLCDKSAQVSTFEATPTFTELISTMTTHIDHTRVEQEVGKYFRYATFSHTWEDNEPLFEKVIKVMVYDLEGSPAHEKLQMFCKLVREAGFNWAWSDTCCINKGDHFMLQEALVSMFKWYERSAMTFIYLRGVGRLAKLGALTRSMWNRRAWTLQEYHASKVVRIYTEDWTPYLGLEIYNHKESPEIISEMEEATGISAQALMALRPGLDDIRDKLQLASTRQTTRVEDAAYSLLGIFSASLPITYGEGDKALGRLLAQLLTSSGDVSILAWTGRSGGFNSCLPSCIAVFSQLPTTHIPLPIPENEMGSTSAGLRSLNPTLLAKLCDQVNELPVPSFSDRRMKLPCLAFKLGQVLVSRNGSERVFRAQTNALGIVEIQTREDLSQLGSLCLVHPWIDFLLDRQPVGGVLETIIEERTDDRSSVLGELPSFSGPSNIASTSKQTRTSRFMSRFGRPFGGPLALDATSPPPPSTLSPVEKRTRVLQFIARLQQPFGALLLTGTRQNMEEYRRVAAESLIKVQLLEITPAILDKLINSVRILDVL